MSGGFIPSSKNGYLVTYSNKTLGSLGDVDLSNVLNGDTIEWSQASETWITVGTGDLLPPALDSIANLSTSGNEMIYTTGTDTYATSAISGAGRSFVSLDNPSQQQTALQLIPGSDVQEHSSKLDTVVTVGNGVADQMLYTTGTDYSNTSLSSFIRTTVLPASSSGALQTALGYIAGPISTTNRLLKVGTSNQVDETGISVDSSNNITGVNDFAVGNDLTVVGTMGGITAAERTQLGNIGVTTISGTQWGYLGGQDQAVDTGSTVTFNGMDASSQLVTNVLDPVGDQDAATKSYVDVVASSGAAPLVAADLATAATLPNSPGFANETFTSTAGIAQLVIDGVNASVGDRVLVKDQATLTTNGVFIVTVDGTGAAWSMDRTTDFDEAATPISQGSQIFISINGSVVVNSGTSWALKDDVAQLDPLSSTVEWVLVGASANLSAGNGIDPTVLSGGTIAADITARLKFTTGELDLNTITVGFGGTGQTTLTSNGVLLGNGTGVVGSSKAAPSGVFVGTSDSQTLTNKVGTASSNNFTARAVFTNSGSNTVSTYAAANPTSGQVLTATAATTATWQTPVSVAFEPDRALFVFQSASDSRPNWSTLEDAITDASALTPTATNPVVIYMYPGTYVEDTPLTIPQFVFVSSQLPTQGSVIIKPSAPAATGSILTMSGNASLYGVVLDGDDGSGGFSTIGLLSSGGPVGSFDNVNGITVRNCSDSLISVVGNGAQGSKILVLRNVSAIIATVSPFTCDNGLECSGGAVLSGNDLFIGNVILSLGAVMDTALFVHGDFSFADMNVMVVQGVTRGLVCGGGTTSTSHVEYPTIRVNGAQISGVEDIGVDILAKSTFTLNSVFIADETGFYLDQVHVKNTNPTLPANPNQIFSNNLEIRLDLIDIINGAANNPANFVGSVFSNVPGEIQGAMLSDFNIGSPFGGRVFSAGQGAHHSIGISVQSDNGGVFTDITLPVKHVTENTLDTDIASTGSIDITSAPATIDGVTPSSGVTTVLLKDGSSANPGTDSIDNGIYVWNGTGNAMTRSGLFPAGRSYSEKTYFTVDVGTVNYGSRWKIDPATIPLTVFVVGTDAFGFQAYSAPAFPSPITNSDAIYVGNIAPAQFPGIKMVLSKPIVLSSGLVTTALVWEYWNGSSWVESPLLAARGQPEYQSYANITFGVGDPDIGTTSNSILFHYRFGEMANWATTSVNSVTAYWVRARVATAANITQIPIIEEIELHTNHTEVGADGYVSYFGTARPTQKECMNSRSVYEPGAGFTSPGNQSITLCDSGGVTMTATIQDGQFSNNQTTAQVHAVNMANNTDTSFPLEVTIEFARATSGGGGGDVALSLNYVYIEDDNVVIGTPTAVGQTTGIEAAPTSTTGGAMASHTFSIDIAGLNTSTHTLWLQFIRNGSDGADTFSQAIYVTTWKLKYRTWATGSY